MARPKPPPKVRIDSVLRLLPEERQLSIFADLKKRGAPKVRLSLQADGIETSVTALYNFAAWWRAELRFVEAHAQRESLLAHMLIQHPTISPDKLVKWADSLFLQTAVAENKLEGYTKLRAVMEKARQVRLDERRLKMLEAKEAKLAAVEQALKDRKAAGGLTPEALELMETTLGMIRS